MFIYLFDFIVQYKKKHISSLICLIELENCYMIFFSIYAKQDVVIYKIMANYIIKRIRINVNTIVTRYSCYQQKSAIFLFN